MKKRLCYCLAIFCIITVCTADEHHSSNYNESNPLKDIEIQVSFKNNTFTNDGSPIPCEVSLKIDGNKENLKNSKWLNGPLIQLRSITTEESQKTGLWFEILNSSGVKVPLLGNNQVTCDCVIENRNWGIISYNLRRIFEITDVGEYKIRVFYELHFEELSHIPKEGEKVKPTHYKHSVFSEWVTFKIVDNSKERDAKIKEYRGAFQSGDKRKNLESLERLEKDTTFEIIKTMSGDLFALTKNTDKAVTEKAIEIILGKFDNENYSDQFFTEKFKSDPVLLKQMVVTASSSESPNLRLLAAKAMSLQIGMQILPSSFYAECVPKWFENEKDIETRRFLFGYIQDKTRLLKAIKMDPDIGIKCAAFKKIVRLFGKDLAIKTAERLLGDTTPCKYEDKDTTIGDAMKEQIKSIKIFEEMIQKDGIPLTDEIYKDF